MGNHFYGALSYADDLTLLAPSVTGLKKMLQVCEKFGQDYGVAYNPVKSVCMLFSRKVMNTPDIKLADRPLKWVTSTKHLGNYIDCNLSETTEIKHKKGDLVQRVNKMLSALGKSPDRVISEAFKAICAHFYGSQAWNLNDKAVSEFTTMWNRCVRRILHLPYQTHTRYLPDLIESKNAFDQISQRFIKFIQCMEKSDNARVKYLAMASLRNANSVIGGNMTKIGQRLKLNPAMVLREGITMLKSNSLYIYNDQDLINLSLIKELREHLNGRSYIDHFAKEETLALLEFVCTA